MTSFGKVVDIHTHAKSSYEKAEKFLQSGEYSESIDKLHDCVENYAKALLTKYNIFYPPNHDVSSLLAKLYSEYSEKSLQSDIYKYKVLPPLVTTHIILSNIRNNTRYGFDTIPGKYLYNKELVEAFFKIVKSFRIFLDTWIEKI